jgi:light-regulated signal transduction histidine kinase (bacteriophytochrome)
LRAPLRRIDGFSQMLLEDCADQLDATGREYLGRIRAGTQGMAQLIDDLLRLSRLGRGAISRTSVDLSELAQAVVIELRQQFPERAVELAIAQPLPVNADANLMRIAMENLIGNAWKFSSRKEAGRIELGSVEFQGKPAYFVRDNGAGFDMQYAHRLFNPFQRLHAASEFEGSGIGLAIVQRVILRHGGRVWAEAVPGQGATFYFTLATQ